MTGTLPVPVPGYTVEVLRDQLDLSEEMLPLVVGAAVAAVIGNMPLPIVAFTGEHGTGKSTRAKILASLIDPSPAPLRTPPRDLEGWTVAAAGSYVVPLDNISSVQEWLSDALCRAVTGDGLVRRKLYSDSELSVLSYRRWIILTSIDPGALRGDLADRLLRIELDRIPENRRRRDQQLVTDWQAAHPAALGALLDLTVEVLRLLADIELTSMPRMADFARVLAGVDMVLGTKGLGTYVEQAATLAVDVVESDRVATEVRAFITSANPEWVGTAAELLDQLTPEKPDKDWPTNPRALSARLTRCAPALRAVQVRVEHLSAREAGTGRRRWRLTGEGSETPSRPSLPSRPAETASVGPPAPSRPSQGPSRPPTLLPAQTPPCDGRDDRDGRIAPPCDPAQQEAWTPAPEPVGPCFLCAQPSVTVDETGRPCHIGCVAP